MRYTFGMKQSMGDDRELWMQREIHAKTMDTHSLLRAIKDQSEKRIERAREYMRASIPAIDVLLVAQTEHMIAEEYAYLCGNPAEDVSIKKSTNGICIITAQNAAQLHAHELSPSDLRAELSKHLSSQADTKRRLCVEATIEGGLYELITTVVKSMGSVTCERGSIVAALRREKTAEEIELMDRGQTELLAMMREDIPPMMYEGMTEYELAEKVAMLVSHKGRYELSFPVIVAFGENASIPHHRPGARPLKNGEPVLIDCGNIYEGEVCTDMTRNYWFGQKSEPLRSSYIHDFEIVLVAQQSATKKYTEGTQLKDVDTEVRAHVGAFPHGLGHGIAQRSVHALPHINQKTTQRFQNGDVVSNEPGIYKTGAYGIRIEDVIAITPGGPRVFAQNTHSRALIEVEARTYDAVRDGVKIGFPEALSPEHIQKNLDALRASMIRDAVDLYIISKTEDTTTNALARTIGFQGTHGYLVMVRSTHATHSIDAYFITDGRYADGVRHWTTHGFTDCFITRPPVEQNGTILPEMSINTFFAQLFERAGLGGVAGGEIVIEPHASAETETILVTALIRAGRTHFSRRSLIGSSA